MLIVTIPCDSCVFIRTGINLGNMLPLRVMDTKQPVIRVSALTKTFGSKKALDEVNFDVPKGSIFGFLGPNGAGKTTTIRCLMDYLRPTKGTITILGHDAHNYSTELKRDIGFLSSDTETNPHWTGNDHIKLTAALKGQSDRVARLISALDFDPTVKVKALSTGNKQKLGIIL